MELKTLKEDIKNNSLRDSFFIFTGDNFLIYQYTEAISKLLNLKINYIESLDFYLTPQISLFSNNDDDNDSNNVLNIYKCSELTVTSNKLNYVKNLIIITDKISEESKKEYSYNIVEMPKIENWMVKDYAYILGEGIEISDLDLFVEMCNYDIYRVFSELSKLSDFGKTQRKFLFKQMIAEGAFSDLTKYNIFSLTNAIQARDIKEIGNILSSKMEIEPLALVSLLYQNFKKLILVWFDKNPTPDSTGLKSNQIWAIRNLPKNYSKDQLINIFKFLTTIDLKLKKGELLNMEDLTSYVIGKILSF